MTDREAFVIELWDTVDDGALAGTREVIESADSDPDWEALGRSWLRDQGYECRNLEHSDTGLTLPASRTTVPDAVYTDIEQAVRPLVDELPYADEPLSSGQSLRDRPAQLLVDVGVPDTLAWDPDDEATYFFVEIKGGSDSPRFDQVLWMSVFCASPPGFVAYWLTIQTVEEWVSTATNQHWRDQAFGTQNPAAVIDQLDAASPREVVETITDTISY